MEVKGHASEVKGRASEVKGHASEVKGRASEVKGRASEVKGHASQLCHEERPQNLLPVQPLLSAAHKTTKTTGETPSTEHTPLRPP